MPELAQRYFLRSFQEPETSKQWNAGRFATDIVADLCSGRVSRVFPTQISQAKKRNEDNYVYEA
jgi:hypothetical protein